MKQIILILTFGMFQFLFAQSDTIVCDSGLKVFILKNGQGPKSVPGDKVKVRFVGKFKDGTVFEQTDANSPAFKFIVGAKEVIPAWDEALQYMNKGSKIFIIVPPALAYGNKGVKDPENETRYVIPPNTSLFYEISLIDIKK